jgi:hypothetical protein
MSHFKFCHINSTLVPEIYFYYFHCEGERENKPLEPGYINGFQKKNIGHSRKHRYLPHRGNRKLTPLPPSNYLIQLLLSETNFSLHLWTAEISSVGGV